MQERTAKDLFLDALDLPAADRSRFLSDACNGDPALRAQVVALLDAHAEAGPFMAGGTPFQETRWTTTHELASGAASARADAAPGDRIGEFVLVRTLGAGGFGTVYLAEQKEPIRREVAIKVLRSDTGCESILARFHRERQALASMDHPGVARILDAGSLETHQPYFVMEYVDGASLIEYCDAHQLDIRARLAIFQQLCFAVRHAHQRGIIHRDLKPSNALVSDHDGKPLCRVIDFGIARAVTTEDDDPTLTIQHQLIGTPQYMSPEQASGDNAGLDTRTDIYSLGVVLYELLTGVTPFDPDELRDAGPIGILQILRDDEPPTPSSRLRTLATRDSVGVEARAHSRGLPARSLQRALKGDLDRVVMKSLQRDREQRYQSADALADDIRRFLEGRPVIAASYGPTRLLLKAARRHWLAASAVTALIVGLGVGLLGALVGGARAERSAREATAVNQFFGDVLGRAKPTADGGDVTLLDALRFAVATIPDRFAAFPEQEILARSLVGEVFLGQTLHRDAKEALSRGYELAQERFGMQDDRTLAIGLDLESALATGGTIEEIEAIGEPLAAAMEARHGRDHRDSIEARRLLAVAFIRRGAWTEAAEKTRLVLADARRVLGPSHPITIRTTVDLAVSLKGQATEESFAEAIALLQPVIDHESASPDGFSRDALDTAYTLAYLRLTIGHVDLAIAMFREILAQAEGRISASHGLLAETRILLAKALLQADQAELAGPLAVAGVEALRERSGDLHPSTMSWMTRALPMLLRGGETERGEEYSRILYERFRGLGHGQSDYSFEFGITHARFLLKNGELDQADSLLTELAPRADSTLPDHVQALYLLNRGELLLARSDEVAAEAALRQGLALIQAGHAEEALENEVDLLTALLACLDQQGKTEQADLVRRELAACQARRATVSDPE